MKVKENISVSMEKKILKEVYCDWCGKKFSQLLTELNGYGRVRVYFGYGSNFDDEQFEFEICDSCFLKYFGKRLKKQYKENLKKIII